MRASEICGEGAGEHPCILMNNGFLAISKSALCCNSLQDVAAFSANLDVELNAILLRRLPLPLPYNLHIIE